jgi:hypothetical protein
LLLFSHIFKHWENYIYIFWQIVGDGKIGKSDGYNWYQHSKAKEETAMDSTGNQSLGPRPAPDCHRGDNDSTLRNLWWWVTRTCLHSPVQENETFILRSDHSPKSVPRMETLGYTKDSFIKCNIRASKQWT